MRFFDSGTERKTGYRNTVVLFSLCSGVHEGVLLSSWPSGKLNSGHSWNLTSKQYWFSWHPQTPIRLHNLAKAGMCITDVPEQVIIKLRVYQWLPERSGNIHDNHFLPELGNANIFCFMLAWNRNSSTINLDVNVASVDLQVGTCWWLIKYWLVLKITGALLLARWPEFCLHPSATASNTC
jgi:hypothetical protein